MVWFCSPRFQWQQNQVLNLCVVHMIYLAKQLSHSSDIWYLFKVLWARFSALSQLFFLFWWHKGSNNHGFSQLEILPAWISLYLSGKTSFHVVPSSLAPSGPSPSSYGKEAWLQTLLPRFKYLQSAYLPLQTKAIWLTLNHPEAIVAEVKTQSAMMLLLWFFSRHTTGDLSKACYQWDTSEALNP